MCEKKCIWCSSANLTLKHNVFRDSKKINAFECRDCNIVFSEKVFYTTQEELNKFYENDYLNNYYKGEKANIEKNFLDQRPYQEVRIERIKDILTNSNSLLEIGCGPGYFLDAAKKYIKNIVGLEKNEAESNYVREKLNIPCFNDITQLNQKFDVIVFNHVLEHVLNPQLFLKSYLKFLNKDGYLIIEVPNLNDSIVSLYDSTFFKNFWYQEPHLYYFNKTSLQNIIATLTKSDVYIKIYQETSFINHFNWVMYNTKSNIRSEAISNNFPIPIPVIADENKIIFDELQGLYENFNEVYKNILQKNGYGDIILAITQIK